jgi:translation initiation factor IF-2
MPGAMDGLGDGTPPPDDDEPGRDGAQRKFRNKAKPGVRAGGGDGDGLRQPRGGNNWRENQRRRAEANEFNEAIGRTAMRAKPRQKGKKGKGRNAPAVPVVDTGPVRVTLTGPITVGELASALEVGAAAVVKDLMKMGVLASMTQSIDLETAITIAEGFGAEVNAEGGDGGDDDTLEASLPGVVEEEDDEDSLLPRPPVITVMGHVDHGKTSLLDALRSSEDQKVDVAAGEAGGITQNIGAYQIRKDDGSITVLDTPGHAAFSQMRGRGANVTDVVILVVAADDGVKEQTVSSIKAAKAAGCPIVVAINKIDKPEANADIVKQGLLQHEVVLEEFGGETLSTEVSAKTGQGLDTLLEQVLLQASLLDLKANPDRMASGVVLEARNAQGVGAVATTLVQKGTLRPGDIVVAGSQWGRVKALLDERSERLDLAGPSAAVELVGLGGLPAAGDVFTVTKDESAAREIAAVRQQLEREKKASSLFAARSTEGRELFLNGMKDDELPLRIIDIVVKADVQGSAQALSQAIAELEAADDKLRVRTRVLREGAGEITSEDVMLASVSAATVVGFNVGASKPTRDEADKLNIQIKEYSVVYDVLDDVNAMMASLIRPPPSKQLGKIVGTADVLQVFKIGAVGKVAGCRVLDGYIRVGCNIRILRGNLITYEGKLQSLRSLKEEAEQVDAGNECGVSFADFQAMLPEDRVEVYLPGDGSMDDEDED